MRRREFRTFLLAACAVAVPGSVLLALLSRSWLALGVMVALVGILAATAVWLAPAFVAHRRQHADRRVITWITVLLSWTFFGWVVALAWALTSQSSDRVAAPA